MYKSILILISILALNINAFSQVSYSRSKVSGIVYDASTLEIIPGAKISVFDEYLSIAERNEGTISDSIGKFTLDDVSVMYFPSISIKSVGYITEEIELTSGSDDQYYKVLLSPKLTTSQTILVEGTMGTNNRPTTAFSIVNNEDIEERLNTQDVPEFLSYLPSTTFYSESGSSVGYSYMSIRGFDQRRLSISVNGVPQNDPEDHNVYWIDMPNLLSNAEMIQVQRGAGNGMVAYPSIGGSINIITSRFSTKPINEYSFTAGSNNYKKYEVEYSSGLVDKKYSFYANLSSMTTDGYRDLSSANYKSFFVSTVRYDEKLTTQLNFYGGWVRGGLNYEGLPKNAISDKDLRQKNYSWWEWDSDSSRFQDWSTKRRDDEKEYFFQPHFELLNEYEINENMNFNSNLFMVLGEGYFDYDGSWGWNEYFRLSDTLPAVKNALIRGFVDNRQVGWNGRLSYKHKNGQFFAGTEIRNHRSLHWGAIQYAETLPEGINSLNYKYYQYRGGVDILSAFIHENYNFTESFSALAEIQIMYNKYQIYDEDFLDNEFEISHTFANPKLGLNYKINDKLSSFVSYSNVSKQPRLKSFYDAAESSGGATPNFEMKDSINYDFSKPLIKPENMNDFELGLLFTNDILSINTNVYYMLFSDEIVKVGQLDRFGQPITGNMDKTTHSGIEFTANLKLNNYFNFIFNTTYSKNIIAEGTTFLEIKAKDGEKFIEEIDLKDNSISGFPDFLMNAMLQFNYSDFTLLSELKYVGQYYSNNFGDNFDGLVQKYSDTLKYKESAFKYTDNVVDAYFVANLMLSYETENTLTLPKMKIYFRVNNIMNKMYAVYAVGKNYFPSAERNFTLGIQIGI